MTKLTSFDVLIVYAQTIAKSASDTSPDNLTPFPIGSRNESYNTVYGHFLDICHQHNLSAAFTTSADIIGPGFCRSYWSFENDHWRKSNSPCYSALIFDKFSPIGKGLLSRRQLLFSNPKVRPFNDPDLFNLFFDKQKTYNSLSEYSIPTISVTTPTLSGIADSCQGLTKLMKSHSGSRDFTTDIIMKDRFGAGGRRVYKLKAGQYQEMLAIILKNTRISYVIQPFVKFDRGFTYQNCPGSTDIRLIYLQGKIAQSYIRMAKPGDFRCNEHQGGSLTYLSLAEIPQSLIAKSNVIANILNKKCSLYALDFIISNRGNVYLLEGNTGPGLDWNMSLIKNEIEAKKLISLIVQELSARVAPLVTYPRLQLVSPSLLPSVPGLLPLIS